jgi:hypothetical protein
MHTCETCGKEWTENYCPECAHTIGGQKKTLAPPALPPPVPNIQTRGAKGRTKSLPPWAVAGIVALALIAIGGVFAYQLKQRFSFPAGYRNRPTSGWGTRIGEKEFDQANDKIDSFTGTSAFGNSAEGEKLARDFSIVLKATREKSFTQGSTLEILDNTKGEFLTYCELHSQECAFIVHVPHLRKFDKSVFENVDARKLLAQLAWMTAQKVLREQGARGAKMDCAASANTGP